MLMFATGAIAARRRRFIMPLQQWSDTILIAELNDEPALSDELDSLMRRLDSLQDKLPNVIVDLKAVTYLNSSNIAQMLRLRKLMAAGASRLRLCSVDDRVWSVVLVTGLDKLFEFTDDISTSLASLQIDE